MRNKDILEMKFMNNIDTAFSESFFTQHSVIYREKQNGLSQALKLDHMA